MTPTREPVVLLSIVVVVAVAASAIAARSYGTWLLEVAPIAVPVLVWTYARFPLTPLSYRILTVSALRSAPCMTAAQSAERAGSGMRISSRG